MIFGVAYSHTKKWKECGISGEKKEGERTYPRGGFVHKKKKKAPFLKLRREEFNVREKTQAAACRVRGEGNKVGRFEPGKSFGPKLLHYKRGGTEDLGWL